MMRLLRSLVPICALLLIGAACNGGGGDATPTATATAGTPPATSTPAGTPTATPGGDQAVCLQAASYTEDGEITVAGDTSGTLESGQVIDLRWDAHDGCERFVIDLGNEDGSAANAPGEVSASVMRDLGVVRVRLPNVESVDASATERMLGGELAAAAYVVRSGEGGLYVDVHLRAAAEAAVTVIGGPARVVVDLKPGGSAIPAAAATGDRVVMLTPRPGSASYPLTVTGYARTFEANVVARLMQDSAVDSEQHTTATAWTDAWGEFSITLQDGPTGSVEVQAGEYSARDGAWEGVGVTVDLQ